MSYNYWLTGKKNPTDDRHAVPADSAVGALTSSLCDRLVTTEQRKFELEDRVGLGMKRICAACATEVKRRS